MNKLTTDEKIVEMVKKSLENGWSASLFKLARILEHRAQFYATLDEIQTAYEDSAPITR